MTRTTTTEKKQAAEEKPTVVAGGPKDSIRETIESIVIAFVLAFLFRTFEAEAFVIPTGSMAPTLMGQHKDLNCPECGYQYQVSASDEDPSEERFHSEQERLDFMARSQVISSVCPNCRYQVVFDPQGVRSPQPPPTYKGDRIIVAKFPYAIDSPNRWDVSVFKYPATAKTNFIKRIVGLPKETLRIYHGDIFTRAEGASEFKIQQKPPAKVQAMSQVVYDNDYALPAIIENGWPARWNAAEAAAPGAFEPTNEYRSYQTKGQPKGEAWLRYQHSVPSSDDWTTLLARPLTATERGNIKPELITDFYAYNTGRSVFEMRQRVKGDYMGLHWVGDLSVECELKLLSGEGQAVLELIEGGRAFRCTFDLASGKATLSADDLKEFHPSATTAVKGPGTHRVSFANVDDKLLLWVDGSLIEFDASTSYEGLPFRMATERDQKSPVGIAARDAQLRVNHLRVSRDIYYIADKLDTSTADRAMSDYGNAAANRDELPPFFERQDGQDNDRAPELRWVDFRLEADQFLALGDNSPRSKDSRLWNPHEYWVSRELLIGKALFVYWPHALDHLPGTDIWFPLFPNFSRMKFVR
jgi:signal peptidase I